MKPKVQTITEGDGVATDSEFQGAMFGAIFELLPLVAWAEELNIEMAERPKLEKMITDTIEAALLRTINDYKLRVADIGREN